SCWSVPVGTRLSTVTSSPPTSFANSSIIVDDVTTFNFPSSLSSPELPQAASRNRTAVASKHDLNIFNICFLSFIELRWLIRFLLFSYFHAANEDALFWRK